MGKRSSQQFLSLVSQYLGTGTQPLTVLEFASGYGMVTRHLAKEQSLNVYSCDIHSQAVHFLGQEIGVHSIQSSSCPEILQLPMQFDVVFALSFLAHADHHLGAMVGQIGRGSAGRRNDFVHDTRLGEP